MNKTIQKFKIENPLDIFIYIPKEPLTEKQLRKVVLQTDWFFRRIERRELMNLAFRENGERLLGRGFWKADNVWIVDDTVKKETFYVTTEVKLKIQKKQMEYLMEKSYKMDLVSKQHSTTNIQMKLLGI